MVDKKYWFPARDFGWGWGVPTTWQGWMVYLVFLVLLGVDWFVVLPTFGPDVTTLCAAVLLAALGIVCWLTGEPPSWRWGRK